jgi:hypothetical protein
MKLKTEEVEFLNGLLSGLDDLPDGAWQNVCEDMIDSCGRFVGRDAYDVWLAWVEATSVKP